MEDLQMKINEMKKKISNIKTDINSFKRDDSVKMNPSVNIRTYAKGSNQKEYNCNSFNSFNSYNKDCLNSNNQRQNKFTHMNLVKSFYNQNFHNLPCYTPVNHSQLNEMENNYNSNYDYAEVKSQRKNLIYQDYMKMNKNLSQNNYVNAYKSKINHTEKKNISTSRKSFYNEDYFKLNNQGEKENYEINKSITSKYSLIKDSNSKNNKKITYEEMVNTMIDYTIKTTGDNDINAMNIVEKYKKLLRESKIKNEFYSQVYDLYKKEKNVNENFDSVKIAVPLFKYVSSLTNNTIEYNKKNNTIDEGDLTLKNADYQNKYQKFCQKIMKCYKLRNFDEFSDFILKLVRKINRNELFLEGIKKILLTEHKKDEY